MTRPSLASAPKQGAMQTRHVLANGNRDEIVAAALEHHMTHAWTSTAVVALPDWDPDGSHLTQYALEKCEGKLVLVQATGRERGMWQLTRMDNGVVA